MHKRKKKEISVKIVEDSVKMKGEHSNRSCKSVCKMIFRTIGMILTFMAPKSSETRQRFPVTRSYVELGWACGACGLRGGCIGSCWGNRREGAHWGDIGVDVWIILGWISRRWYVGIWTELGWPRIETGGGRL